MLNQDKVSPLRGFGSPFGSKRFPPFLLDKFEGVAVFSFGRLDRDTTTVARIRRSSDNAEQDFTRTEFDDGTVAAFIGSGDGYLVTWYDQSGAGNHATQEVLIDQPRIVLEAD